MNCRDCLEHLYEYLDQELTPELEQEIRTHLRTCPPCGEYHDFEEIFLKFLKVRCQTQGAPSSLKHRILEQLFDE